MLRKFLLAAAAAALLPAAVSQAAFEEGDWDLTLSGSAYHSADFDGSSINVNAQLGYFINPNIAVGARQGISFYDYYGSDLAGDTSIFADYHFDALGDKGEWVPYVGLRLGYIWGEDTHNTWYGAPEAGVKYFVNSTTYVYVGLEYDFYFDSPSGYDDGQFVWGLGLGVRL